MRTNDLARELGVKSKDILESLPALGIMKKRSHSSQFEDGEVAEVREFFRSGSRSTVRDCSLSTVETLPVTSDVLTAVRQVVAAELFYERATGCGRKFGITGEVGEILVCGALGLKLVKNPRSAGFNAMDDNGDRVEIKARRGESDELPKDTGRLSKFSGHDFDYALMGILTREYELFEIWMANAGPLKAVIGKHKGRNPTIRQFKAIGSKLYPSADLTQVV